VREAREKVKEMLGKGWPGNPGALSARLKKAGPALRQIGVAIDWPTHHGDSRIINITSSSTNLCNLASQASQVSQVDKQRLSDPNQFKGLEQDESGKPGRGGDDAGTKGGRSVESISSPDKRLKVNLNAAGLQVGDTWDATSRDLIGSSSSQSHVLPMANVSEATSGGDFQSTAERAEGHAAVSQSSTDSPLEAGNRRIWRGRL
jgi:hypothetical protein